MSSRIAEFRSGVQAEDRVAQRIKDALDPQKAPGKPRLCKDMTEAERAQVVAAMKRR